MTECLPFLPLSSPWGPWAALIACGAMGLIAEERTKIGRELSGALCSTLFGMILTNLGGIPPSCPEIHTVFKYILPLAIPLLLFNADLSKILRQTREMLPAFLLGSATVILGSCLAYILIPLGTYLGDEGWKIAAALTARHIGGAVNYMSICESLKISSSTFGSGLAADDLILTMYFTTIFALARRIPPETQTLPPSESGSTRIDHQIPRPSKPIYVTEAMTALSISSAICYASFSVGSIMGWESQFITIITAITICLATIFSKLLSPLGSSAVGVAQILMMIFYAAIGASANVSLVIRTAPVLFVFSALSIGFHLIFILCLGHVFGYSRKNVLLASNANIGGPSTVGGMASSKGWESLVVPAILVSTLGYAVGTPLGLGLGQLVLKFIT